MRRGSGPRGRIGRSEGRRATSRVGGRCERRASRRPLAWQYSVGVDDGVRVRVAVGEIGVADGVRLAVWVAVDDGEGVAVAVGGTGMADGVRVGIDVGVEDAVSVGRAVGGGGMGVGVAAAVGVKGGVRVGGSGAGACAEATVAVDTGVGLPAARAAVTLAGGAAPSEGSAEAVGDGVGRRVGRAGMRPSSAARVSTERIRSRARWVSATDLNRSRRSGSSVDARNSPTSRSSSMNCRRVRSRAAAWPAESWATARRARHAR